MRPILRQTAIALIVLGLCALVGLDRPAANAQRVTSAGEDLLSNPGFEDPDASTWRGGERVTQHPHGGTFCLRIIDDSDRLSVAASTVPLPVDRERAYRLSGWVRADREDAEAWVTVTQNNPGGRWIPHHNLDQRLPAGTDWSRFEVLLTAGTLTPETRTVRVYLRPTRWTSDGTSTGTAWFDDVVFEPVTVEREAPWVTHYQTWNCEGNRILLAEARCTTKVLPDVAPNVEFVIPGRYHSLQIHAARGETEATQLVLVPTEDARRVRVTASEGGGGESSLSLVIREVACVEVAEPSYPGAMRGPYPDPLPLHGAPLDVPAGRTQAFWISASIPRSLTPGTHTRSLQVHVGEASMEVPLRVYVYAATLPERPALQTAYGLSAGTVARYHNVGGADLDAVMDAYYRDFAAHRISPYDPMQRAPFTVTCDWNWDHPAAPDPLAPDEDNRCLRLTDDDDARSLAARAAFPIPLAREQAIIVRWRAFAEDAHDYGVTLSQHDAAGQWISGNNQDLWRETTAGEWVTESVRIDPSRYHADARSLRLTLWPRRWRPDGRGIGTTWFDDLHIAAEGEPDANLVRNGDLQMTPDGATITIDWSRFDAAAERYLDGLGFTSFRLRLPGMGWGHWQGSAPGRFYAWTEGSPEFERIMERLIGQIADHLRERGWLAKAYAYWFDEPQRTHYEFVRRGMERIARAAPDLRRLLTEQPEEPLFGAVDIWVPLTQQYDRAMAQQRQEAGDEVWWYVCTGPKPPWPNDFIEEPGVHPRVRFWQAFHEGIQGSLYWQTTYWTEPHAHPDGQDPWTDPMSWNWDLGRQGGWGNGDGRLLYPPRGWRSGEPLVRGPVPSIRWELIRDGVEDFDLLTLLRAEAGRLAGSHPALVREAREILAAVPECWEALNAVTVDPDGVVALRRRLLACLDACAETEAKK